MKRKIFISLIISFIIVLAYNVQALAETDITRVTTNSHEDSFPCVKDNYLVWQGHVNGHWQIFLYNIEDGGTTQITNNNHDSIAPQTDGEYVVWFGAGNQGGEIFLYNISNGVTTQITSDTNVDSPPRIANGLVVWTSHEVIGSIKPGEIILYDIGALAGQQQQLTYNNLDDVSPKINSQFVVWLQIDGDDNSALFVHDLSNGNTTEVPENFIWEDNPQTDGYLTVSMWNDGSDWEIIVRKDGENGFDQITDNTVNDRSPRISVDNIAWVGGEGNNSEIYLATYAAAEYAAAGAGCPGNHDVDSDVDGSDLAKFAQGCSCNVPLSKFAENFGRTDCPPQPSL